MTTDNTYDTIIIGGGVAGLTAGMYSARDGFKTLILESIPESSTQSPGGALLLTPDIANFPGFLDKEGYLLVQSIRNQASGFGADIKTQKVTTLTVKDNPKGVHTVITNVGEVFTSRTIIIATGATARLLGVPGEMENYGEGVSTCATCDGFFFQDQPVVIVGGGDTAVEDALLLSTYATEVHMLVRGNTLRSTGPEARELPHNPKITIHYNTTVTEVISCADGVTGVNINKDGVLTSLNVNGMFVAVGSDPATNFLIDVSEVELDTDGYILTAPNSTEIINTGYGIFAAGDVADKIYRQAITSAGTAAQAAIQSRHYLQRNKI